MSKFGSKFTCWSCGTKFYDLNKPNPLCPKCGSDPSQDPNLGKVSAPDDFGTYGDDFDGDLEDESHEEEEDEGESEGELDEGTVADDDY